MHALCVPWSTVRWRSTALMLTLVIGHAAVFYAVAHTRMRVFIIGGASMFGPVISEVWQPQAEHPLLSRGVPQPEAPFVKPPDHWRFPPIDLWPSPPGYSAAPSAFTPVIEAEADPPDAPELSDQERDHAAPARHPHLRMTRWLRPQYAGEWASTGQVATLVLDLRLDPQGRPVDIGVEQSSGVPRLDESALQAASAWRFAWPPSKYPPGAMWARIELRFN